MDISKIQISQDNTHHIFNNKPLYAKRFQHVLKFHKPGLAPVLDDSGAYHINIKGEATYDSRFIKTFGFYFEKAAVITNKGWGHIDTSGELFYKTYYDWAGNYQDDVCTVRDKSGHYFHIDKHGKKLYSEEMLYAGDYRDGVAVVRKKNCSCTHINKKGELIHGKYFIDLDIYHKRFARARDNSGWFHIDLKGEPVYNKRFSMVEPFYNDFAIVEDFDMNKIIINENGEVVHQIYNINQFVK
ncbi:MAG: methyltransferase [Candidatus Heimdallarchaeota archaeon]